MDLFIKADSGKTTNLCVKAFAFKMWADLRV